MAEEDAHRFFQQLVGAVVSEYKSVCGYDLLTVLNSHDFAHIFSITSTVVGSPTET